MNDLPTTPKTGFRVLLTRPRPPAGTSLLLTLVVLSAIVVLLVMMSRLVTVERRVTQGYSDILRAEMAAQAGTAEATSILVELFSKHPDSVTFWDPNMGGTTTPGTVFMYRDMPPDQEHPGSATTSTPPNIYAIPLISGSSVRQYYPTNDYAATLPAAATANPPAGVAKTYVDINEPNAFGTRTSTGWIGALPGKTTLPGEIRVPWMKVLKDPTAPEDHNVAPTTRLKKNPPVIRYAWWIEDESFKVNVNTAKGSGRGPLLAEVDPSGYLKPKPSLQGLFSNAVAEQLSLARTNMLGTDGRMLSVFQLGHSKSLPEGFTTAQEFGDTYKFLLTTESSGLDLTRAGALRFNLNEAVERTYSNVAKDVSGHPDLSIASVDVPGNTKRTIGQIAAAISRNSPRFGQRFYRNNSTVPTPSNYAGNPKRDAANMVKFTAQDPHQDLYVQKLAANIFDYGSPTRNPTVINNAGVVSAGKPVFTLTDLDYQMDGIPKNPYPNPVWAIGKKAIPYLTEYVMHARHVTSEPSAGLAAQYPGVIRQFKIDIDHYFEFWNMSTEDIRPNLGDLGPDPVLVMENQPAISATGDADPAKMPNYPTGADVPAGRAFEIKLDRGFRKRGSNTSEKIVFEAGKLTIITTDPDWETHAVNLKIPADTAVYVAEELYAPGSGTRCDQGISLPPHVQEAWSGDVPNRVTSTVQNVRSYIMPCFNKDADDNRPEVQMGRDDDREDNRVGRKAKLLMSNKYGLLDAHLSLAMRGPKKHVVAFKDKGNRGNPLLNHFRGSYLAGGNVGNEDPRSNLEAIQVQIDSENASSMLLNGMEKADPDDIKATDVRANSNLGAWPGNPVPSTFNFWPTDRTPLQFSAMNAPMIVSNGPLRSIAELGNIYDPLRNVTSALDAMTRRGGGRTLTVGQPDVFWKGTRSATAPEDEMLMQVDRSRNWAAWRLADVFTVNHAETQQVRDQLEISGLYNPNGILRDHGQALKALLAGLQFEAGVASDPALQGKSVSLDKLDTDVLKDLTATQSQIAKDGGAALARYLGQRLSRQFPTRFSPLWERGELSQLELFSPYGTKSQIKDSVSTANLNDRGREELFRRLVDLITTRGNTFSIYVVGQALNADGQPIATKAQRILVRLHPKFDPPLELDFDPSDSSAVSARFRKPDTYLVEVLSTEDA